MQALFGKEEYASYQQNLDKLAFISPTITTEDVISVVAQALDCADYTYNNQMSDRLPKYRS